MEAPSVTPLLSQRAGPRRLEVLIKRLSGINTEAEIELAKSLTPECAMLVCPKCGNTKEFREIAKTETAQCFTVGDGGEVDWQASEILDEPNEPLEIRCQKCDAIVWETTMRVIYPC